MNPVIFKQLKSSLSYVCVVVAGSSSLSSILSMSTISSPSESSASLHLESSLHSCCSSVLASTLPSPPSSSLLNGWKAESLKPGLLIKVITKSVKKNSPEEWSIHEFWDGPLPFLLSKSLREIIVGEEKSEKGFILGACQSSAYVCFLGVCR